MLGPGQPSPRLLTLPRPDREFNNAGWTSGQVILLGMLMVAPLLFGAVQAWAWGSITVITTILLPVGMR